jgi:hypothetical protein
VFVNVKGATYIDLVIISVARTDAGGQVGKASFGVELKQIATVGTKTVDLPPVPKSKAPKQRGAQPPKPTTPAQAEDVSILYQGGAAALKAVIPGASP